MNWLTPPTFTHHNHQRRQRFLLGALCLAACILGARLITLQILDGAFLKAQGLARTVRVVEIPTYRGFITDRRGEPIAVSTPIDSIWVNPKNFKIESREQINNLGNLLKISPQNIAQKLKSNATKQFIYLKRDVTPDISAKVKQLGIPGLYLKREFRRYYPAGPETAQLVGFTNIDDIGQSGIEVAFESSLKPTPGKIRVLEDRAGRWVQDLESIKVPKPGQNIMLSIDLRIQAIALKELQDAVTKAQAKSGTLVMLDITTGEVLAMVSAPSFNPNNRTERTGPNARARALTDQLEPGSTAKPFSILSALESGHFTANTIIETDPGYFRVGRNIVRDVHNYGTLTVSQVLAKSSNIGITKIALALPPEQLVNTFREMGLGTETLTSFPGESSGIIHGVPRGAFALATFAFGYSFMVTPIQLAHAYATLANHGQAVPISLLKVDAPPKSTPIVSAANADNVFHMLTHVTEAGGTGTRAHIAGYLSAGKTGTTRVVGPHGYDAKRHVALFAGVTPVENPKLATIIIIEEPQGLYYGGAVSAPVYAKVVGAALHLLNVPPDDLGPDNVLSSNKAP